MKSNKTDKDYIKEILDDLKELGKEFPHEPLTRHLGLATAAYSHIEQVPSNKELAYLLNQYYQGKKLELDSQLITFDQDITDFNTDDFDDLDEDY